MSEPQWQTCPKCGERWWDSHVCRNTLNSLKIALAPTCQFCGQAARAQPAQAGQVLSDEDVLRAAARTLDSEVVEVSPLSCIKDFARAIEAAVLAKRVPMTPEETDAAMKLLFYPARNRAFIDGVEAAELHHGIVGEKGGAT